MDHYIEISLMPSPEFPAHILMSALYSRLHGTLANAGRNDVGVSFPQMGISGVGGLGAIMRLHGLATTLVPWATPGWLSGLKDHCEHTSVLPIPDGSGFRTVSRVQAKSNVERLRRRQMRRHGLTEVEAREHVPESAEKTLSDPFVRITSSSTGQTFLLFVRHGPIRASPVYGAFTTYGLSRDATIPWF